MKKGIRIKLNRVKKYKDKKCAKRKREIKFNKRFLFA